MFGIDEEKPKSSWLDEAVLRFEQDNDALILQTRSLLNRVVPNGALHGRFVNTLSMLEHMGCHKILSTQHSLGIDQETLKHIAEEAHHAFFMKRQAEKAAGRPLEFVANDLLAPASARMYFQRLEAAMLRTLERRRSARVMYLYMSLIVEFRALWFYRLYQQTLKRNGHPMSLKRVLGEEQNHLRDIARNLETAGELDNARVSDYLGHEKALYMRLLGAMQHAV
jgi:hypothetical protein